MKRILSVVLALAIVATMFVMTGCSKKPAEGGETKKVTSKVAMITDYGDITDQSFNQSTYEACKAFGEKNSVDFKYYKPAGDSTAERVAMIETAIADGYDVLVLPGYAFGGAIVDVASDYPDVKFIALDVAKGDLLEAGVAAKGEKYDYQPDNWDLAKYVDLSNVYCAVYQEELCGYMAGYAAVKLGYEKLGFLGGMAVPAVIRYGFGYVQGVDAAAKELNKNVELNYVYGGQFFGDADITAAMETWYKNGTQVVFACGGGIFSSAGEAAVKYSGKLIGVDNDQSGILDAKYGKGITVTSAMKGLYAATYDTLTDVVINGKWSDYVGKIATLGLVSTEDMTLNYVQIPFETTQFVDGKFTKDDYKALVKKMYDGDVKVSNDITKMPTTTNVKVNDQGQLKG